MIVIWKVEVDDQLQYSYPTLRRDKKVLPPLMSSALKSSVGLDVLSLLNGLFVDET
ncbi:MAG: hypothetical protein QXD31_03890 [Candidatus Caldarchaeum sp.]